MSAASSSRSLEKESSFALVAGERGGMLKLAPGLGKSAHPEQKISLCCLEGSVALQGLGLIDLTQEGAAQDVFLIER